MVSPEEHASQTLPQVFGANVARHPDAPAVGDAGTLVTYGELDAHADHLARELAACGVQRGDRVGLRLERGVNAVIAMLGSSRRAPRTCLPLPGIRICSAMSS